MINFLKKWLVSVASGAVLLGLLFAAFSAWTVFETRNLSSEPVALGAAELGSTEGLTYAAASGGNLDLANAIAYEVKRKRRSRVAMLTNYYIPVVDDSNQVMYLLKTSEEPSTLKMTETSQTGLVDSSDELPSRVYDNFHSAFNKQQFSVLDATYSPKSMLYGLGMVLAGLGVAVIGFFTRKFLLRGPRDKQVYTNELARK